MTQQFIRVINLIQKKFFAVAVITFSFWLYVLSMKDKDFENLPDNILEQAYFTGKKLNKVKYNTAINIGNIEQIEQITKAINNTKSTDNHDDDDEYEYDRYESIKEKLDKLKNQDTESDNWKSLDYLVNENEDSKNSNNINNNNIKGVINYTTYTTTTNDFYGRNVKFLFDIDDLCAIISVNSSLINQNKSLLLWDSLVKHKTELNRLQSKTQNTNDVILFNLIPIKQLGVILSCALVFFIIHLIHYEYENDFAFKYKILFHSFCFVFSYSLGAAFYNRFYYVGSSIMLSQGTLSIKYFIEEFFYLNGYREHECDIFNIANAVIELEEVTVISLGELQIKLFISLILTVTSLYQIFFFPYFMNYMIFYSLIVYILYITSLYLSNEITSIFLPFRKFIFVTVGLFNFILTKFHKYIVRGYNKHEVKVDSFYIVSDLFSLTCIAYISDYLTTQGNQVNDMFENLSLDNNDELTKLINKKMNNMKDKTRDFSLDDIFWIYTLCLGLLFIYIGLAENTYICFFFGIYYFKLILKSFKKFFSLKVSRIVYSIIIFIIISTNHLMSLKIDTTLMDLLDLTNTVYIHWIRTILRLAGVLLVLLIISTNIEYIFTYKTREKVETIVNEGDTENKEKDNVPEKIVGKVKINSSITYDKKKKKNIKTIQISLISDDNSLKITNIIYILIDSIVNHFLITLIFYIIKENNKIGFIIMFYIILLFLLFIRVLCLIGEFKNNTEYLIATLINFFLSLRLVSLAYSSHGLYIGTCIYLLLLISIYCSIDKRHFFLTFILIINLFSSSIYLNSNFLFVIMQILIFLPFSVNNENKKYGNCTYVGVFVTMSVIVTLQSISFKVILPYLVEFTNHTKNFFLFDLIGGLSKFCIEGIVSENTFITFILDGINYIANYSLFKMN